MFVSTNCFKSVELRAWGSSHEKEETCELTKTNEHVIDITSLSEFFKTLFSLYIKDEKGEPLYTLIQNDWHIFSDDIYAKDIILEALKSTHADIKYDDNVVYLPEIFEPKNRWNTIKKELVSNVRFFAGDLINPEDDQWDFFFSSNYIIKSESKFYRGRINENINIQYETDKELNMPDKKFARAGRANVYGIPYMYMATDADTVMYECRAMTGDHISIGEYELKEDVDVVDFTLKPDLFYIFQNQPELFISTVQRYLFLSEVSRDMSKPVRRYDIKEIDYLPTQFVCEFIRRIAGGKGIIFQSSQNAEGKNVVLFENKYVKFNKAMQKIVGTTKMEYAK